MNSREKIRQKYEESKRNCLMRKIRFYEYLIGYGNTEKKFVPGVEIKNKTTSFFFPILNPLTPDDHPIQKPPLQKQFNTIDSSNQESQHTNSVAKEAKTIRSAKREAFRLTKRENVDNITELITKSMTPSIRINKKTIQPSTIQNKFKNRRIKPEWSLNEKDNQKLSRLSPKKRTYIGDVCYMKQSKKQVEVPTSYRKQSICPWEIENELPY